MFGFRHRRDGETDRGHARHHFRPETTQEGETAKEGSSSTTHAYRFFVQQARKGLHLLKEGDKHEEGWQEERRRSGR